VIDQVRVSRVDKACGLVAEVFLGESAVKEGIFHIELLNGPVTGDNSGEHRKNSGRFYNRAEGLIIVDSGALSEPRSRVPSARSLCMRIHLSVTTLEP
jgi:hypothetical protein